MHVFRGRVRIIVVRSRIKVVDVRRTWRWQQDIENLFFDIELCFFRYLVDLFLTRHVYRNFSEVANHALDIAPDIADFGKLRSFDFEKGGV